jgi:hypothetical protein
MSITTDGGLRVLKFEQDAHATAISECYNENISTEPTTPIRLGVWAKLGQADLSTGERFCTVKISNIMGATPDYICRICADRAISETNMVFTVIDSLAGNTHTELTSPAFTLANAAASWHFYEIYLNTSGDAYCFIDGTLYATISGKTPTTDWVNLYVNMYMRTGSGGGNNRYILFKSDMFTNERTW